MSARSAEMQQEGSSLRMMGSACSQTNLRGSGFGRWRLLMVQLIEKSTPGTRGASFLLRSLRRSCDVAVILGAWGVRRERMRYGVASFNSSFGLDWLTGFDF